MRLVDQDEAQALRSFRSCSEKARSGPGERMTSEHTHQHNFINITHVSADSSTPRRTSVNTSIRTQPPARKPNPKITVVLTTRQHLVSLNNSIAGIEERRATRLELHAVEYELRNERIAVLGDEGQLLAEGVDLLGAVEVACGDAAVFEGLGWEERLRVAVLLDEALGDDPEDLSPDFSDGVYAPVAWLIQGLVSGGVDGLVL